MAKIGDVCASKIDTLSAAYNGKIDYIDISAVDNREKKITQTAIVLAKDAPSRAKQLVEHGDVIVSLVRPNLNAVAIIEEQSQNLQVASTGYCVLRCNQMIYNRYLFYFCQSETFVNSMTAQATGASYPAVSNSIVKNCEIPLPERNKQKEIADILDKVTSLISLRKQQLVKLDELVKARFVEMFGDPKDNHSNLVKIGEIGDLTSGGTPSRSNSEYFNGSIRWYSAGELNSLYLPDSIEHISRTALSQSAAKLFEKGTLMIGMYDTAAFKMGILTEQSSSNQACANLKPTEQYSVIWLYYLFDIMKPIFLNERQDVRQKNLSLSKIRNFNIPSAPLALQNQFAAFVERVDQQKQTVQQSLEKLELMKKALMQEYFG